MSAGPSLRHFVAAAMWLAGLGTPTFALDRVASRSVGMGLTQVAERNVAVPASVRPAAQTATVPAERGRIAVAVDRAKVIRLPDATRTVIVGNPAIADVAMQKSGIVVVTGRSYGETNLIALDGSGNMLAESSLTVEAKSDAIVTVQRGLERQSYSCTPSCMPAVQLGDATTYFATTKDQALQHSQFSNQR
jgi:Flp pilus assembly secretin CpaC